MQSPENIASNQSTVADFIEDVEVARAYVRLRLGRLAAELINCRRTGFVVGDEMRQLTGFLQTSFPSDTFSVAEKLIVDAALAAVSNQTINLPTDEQVGMANLERGPTSAGGMTCSDCGKDMLLGEPVFWTRPSYEYPSEGCDPYCATCCINAAGSMTAICEALEIGELEP